MLQKNFRLLGLVLLLLLTAVACQTTKFTTNPNSLVKWRSLADGEHEAKEKGMPVLIDFFSGGQCIRCEYFENTIYNDPEIADRVNRNFVPVRIYKNWEPTIAELKLIRQLSPDAECVLAFLDKNGHIVNDEKGEHISSFDQLDKKEFNAIVDKALASLK